MATTKTTKVGDRVAVLEKGAAEQAKMIEQLAARGDASAMLEEIKAGQRRIEEALRGLAKVIPAAMLSTPQPLKPDDVRLMMRDNSAAKFRVIAAAPHLGMRPGEVIEAQTRFASVQRFVSHVEGGVIQVVAA